MRYFIHIVTDAERLIDPGGAEFLDLESARTEACQSARDLMAEELRGGRPVPLGWRIQVADEDGSILFTLPFARLVFTDDVADAVIRSSRRLEPEYDLMLIERAMATFARARQSHAEIRTGLTELRNQVRQLAQLRSALGRESA